jgi:hypothetical protein
MIHFIDDIFENIDIINTYTFSELAVVIGKDTRKPTGINPLIPRNINERPLWIRNPEWVRNLPGLENYMIGIGISERYSVFYKGILVADVKAAQAIASEKGTYIRNYLYDYVINSKTNLEFGNIALTQAELVGFYILDRWIEPDGSLCYSLGIARKN